MIAPRIRTVFLGLAALLLPSATLADAPSLPKPLVWTAYGVGSAGHAQAAAIGAALKQRYGADLRILPGKNDIARSEPLRQGKAHFSATGVGGSFMAQEGVFAYGAPNWGPQPVRVLLANNGGTAGLALAVAAEACAKAGKPGCAGFAYADLKGLRVAWVKGAPALNVNNEAYLAYGGLSWDDVEKTVFGGYGAAWAGLINDQVDAVFGATNSGKAYEAAAGPRGLYWPPIDPGDAEGLARMRAVAPFFAPTTATVGAGIDDGPGAPTAGYAYPVLIAMADQDADLAYAMTRALVESFPDYDGAAPGIGGWATARQNFAWVAPFHEGAIRYWREIGLWTDEAEARNARLIARQEALRAAWDALAAEQPEDWPAAWAARRRDALAAGGFEPAF